MDESQEATRFRVLLVDNDDDVADVVLAILSDAGYTVGVLTHPTDDTILAAVGQQEPDCILLDGSMGSEYASGWARAAYLAARERSIPTVMFSAHVGDVAEAREGVSERAVAADFAAILEKPFSLDELLDAVAVACGRSEPFDRSEQGDRDRTLRLARRLRALGASDIRTSDRREWATFRPDGGDRLVQLYWWQRMGVYIVGAYDEHGALRPIGQFFDLDAALTAAAVSS